jgi:hypothetical protein
MSFRGVPLRSAAVRHCAASRAGGRARAALAALALQFLLGHPAEPAALRAVLMGCRA